MVEISHHMMVHDPTEMLFRSIPAGFLMAAMVWLIPSAEGAGLSRHHPNDLPDRDRRLRPHHRRQL